MRTSPNKATHRGGRPSASNIEARAEEIRIIATEVFVEFGYERASLAEIAKRAGASKETIYAQYADKSDLFVAVTTSHLKTALVHFDILLDENRPLEKALRVFGFQLVTAVLGPYQAFVHLIFEESERFPELGKLFWETGHLRGYRDLARYFRKQIDAGHLAAHDPELMARQFLNLLTADIIFQSLLNVQRALSESQRKALANTATTSFLRMYGILRK